MNTKIFIEVIFSTKLFHHFSFGLRFVLLPYPAKGHIDKDFDNWINDNCKNFELIQIGSSLKFCYLAESKANIYPRLGPTSEWDIAAGHIILEEAGGSVKDFNENILLYNTKESVINPNFIAKI